MNRLKIFAVIFLTISIASAVVGFGLDLPAKYNIVSGLCRVLSPFMLVMFTLSLITIFNSES